MQKVFAEEDKAKLRAALLDKDHIDAMQKLRDRELAATLRKMAEYDPAAFQKRMKQLHDFVGPAPPK